MTRSGRSVEAYRQSVSGGTVTTTPSVSPSGRGVTKMIGRPEEILTVQIESSFNRSPKRRPASLNPSATVAPAPAASGWSSRQALR